MFEGIFQPVHLLIIQLCLSCLDRKTAQNRNFFRQSYQRI